MARKSVVVGVDGSPESRRALELAELSDRPQGTPGIELTPLARRIDEGGYHYSYVDVQVDATARTATLTVHAPATAQPGDLAGILAAFGSLNGR